MSECGHVIGITAIACQSVATWWGLQQ